MAGVDLVELVFSCVELMCVELSELSTAEWR
jgi:hypothetical protein